AMLRHDPSPTPPLRGEGLLQAPLLLGEGLGRGSSDFLFTEGVMTSPVRIGIVTVSDRASRGVYEDRGGPAIRDCLTEILPCPWEAVPRLIPDEQPVIEATLIELCDQDKCCLVVTTGGTGPAVRDVTPEATETVCPKMMPGFGELMRDVS